jgi:hypothetical protein
VQQKGHENSVIRLNAGVPGAESIQTGLLTPNVSGQLLLAFKAPDITINAQRYCGILLDILRVMKERPGKLTTDVIMLHDKARPHVARTVQNTLRSVRWKKLDHHPYSPDLSPCDSHMFGPHNKVLKGRRFGSDGDVKTAVVWWFQQHPRDFFAEGIIGWCVNGMPASTPMGTIFNVFTGNNVLKRVSFEQVSYMVMYLRIQ